MFPVNNENKVDADLSCIFQKSVLIRFINGSQGHRDSLMHAFSCSSTEVNKAVTKVRTTGDRLPLIMICRFCYPSLELLLFYGKKAKLIKVAQANRPFSYSTKEPGSCDILIQFYSQGSIELR